MAGVLEALICASERAANVARSCCTGSPDETLLVAEKGEGDANTRFEKDFKTIADVLAQECAKHEIGSRYPALEKYVRGEECPDIGGVCIELQNAPDKTAELLGYVVPDATASRMAKAAHSPIASTIVDLPEDLPSFNTEDLAVWIDPIDATAEFISGVNGTAKADSGLPCVTVLIGAYRRSTGEPVLGVINQPFFDNGKGRIIWGVNYEGTQRWGGSNETSTSSDNVVLMSGGEKPEVIEKFTQSGWDVEMYPGAGHKLLKVALGEAAAYIVSQGTTYRWDTCAPHAIIRARGGNVVNFSAYEPIEYNAPESLDTQTFCNCNGIIAYNEQGTLEKIKNLLQ